jgi:hypothetical protein
MNLQKEFVPYDLALRMKELGFDEPCLAIYDNYTDENDKDDSDRFFYIRTEGWNKDVLDKVTPAPLFSQAFRWFREKYGLHHVIHHFTHKKGTDEEYLAEVGKADDTFSYCKTYEEAELACLEKLIEIVEQKQKENG